MVLRRPLPTKDAAADEQEGPLLHGTAIAVIFDWATAVRVVVLLGVTLAQRGTNARSTAAAALLALIFAPPFVVLGELLRRARPLSRILQLAVASVIALISIAGLLRDLGELFHGILPRSTNLPSLLASLYVLWGFTRPPMVRWFTHTTPAAARQRHSGPWLLLIIAISIVVGIAAVFINLA